LGWWWRQGHQPRQGLAGLGQQDRFTGMGIVNQAREMGLGLMHVHDAQRILNAMVRRLSWLRHGSSPSEVGEVADKGEKQASQQLPLHLGG
jgi:hypothetical protein